MHDELTARFEDARQFREKPWRQQAPADLMPFVIRLWMIAMDFANAVIAEKARDELLAIDGGKADIRQAAMIGPPRRIAQYERQKIDADVVPIGMRERAAEQEAAVAAPEIDDQRSGTAEESRPNRSGRAAAASSARCVPISPAEGLRREWVCRTRARLSYVRSNAVVERCEIRRNVEQAASLLVSRSKSSSLLHIARFAAP